MDILLAGNGPSPWKGSLPALMSSAATYGNHSGASRTLFRSKPKNVRLPPGIVFGISCSASPRNPVRLRPESADTSRPASFSTNIAFGKREMSGRHLPQKQRVGCSQTSYLQACRESSCGNVVKTVDVVPSRFNRPQHQFPKPLELKRETYRVTTGDHLRPRRMKGSCKSSLFSTTCELRTWRRPVEACGALLKREALDSYKIIYN
jgi:hypothetical protein